MSHFDAALEAELLTQDFRNMYVEWGSNSPLRTGMHASAILDTEFCVREQVLHALSPEQGEKPASNPWDWQRNARFETGWDLHRRWQRVFKQCGNVVYMAVTPEQAAHIPPALLKKIDGQTCAPELDLTHYDSERNLFFSPDAILLFGGEKYVVEIKGIKQESYVELTDDLEQACAVCETVYKAREQCNFYLHLLGLSRGVILIENKNTCDFKVYVIEYEPERALPYSKRLYAVKRDLALARAHGVVASFPVRRCTSSQDRRALSCPMRTVCFSRFVDELPGEAHAHAREFSWRVRLQIKKDVNGRALAYIQELETRLKLVNKTMNEFLVAMGFPPMDDINNDAVLSQEETSVEEVQQTTGWNKLGDKITLSPGNEQGEDSAVSWGEGVVAMIASRFSLTRPMKPLLSFLRCLLSRISISISGGS